MKKAIKINKTVSVYRPKVLGAEFSLEKEEQLNSNTEHIKIANKLLLSPYTKQVIFKHIGWGIDTNYNNVEQGGLLIGHTYVNDKQELIGHAEQAIPAKTAKGSMTYLEFNHSTWKIMLDKLDNMNESLDEDLQIVGWYHTHPGLLSVFMSGTDLNTQRKMFGKEWQYAIVLNPQKQIWRAFCGAEAKECKGYILK